MLVARGGAPKRTLRPTGVMTLSAVEEKLKACGRGHCLRGKKRAARRAGENGGGAAAPARGGGEKAERSQPQRKYKSRAAGGRQKLNRKLNRKPG